MIKLMQVSHNRFYYKTYFAKIFSNVMKISMPYELIYHVSISVSKYYSNMTYYFLLKQYIEVLCYNGKL